MAQRHIRLSVDDASAKRVKDPYNRAYYHLEAYVAFSEAAKLPSGNANVRPPKENCRPFKKMMESVAESPELFHIKNRGITYLCQDFRYDNVSKELVIEVPNEPDSEDLRFGIADGGHTREVIDTTLAIQKEQDAAECVEPYVRIRFLSSQPGALPVEEVVESLNTSTQVKQATLEEYKQEFEELKSALTASGFDTSHIGWRENENRPWEGGEVIQRMAYFLPERWKRGSPSSIYRSKDKALQMYISPAGRKEFQPLYPIAATLVTFPEFIQTAMTSSIESRKIGKVKGVKKLPKPFKRESTEFVTRYKMDNAIVAPMAAAFRKLLVPRGDVYVWGNDPYEVFNSCAEDLYAVLLERVRRVKTAVQLASDQEYWQLCEIVVMQASAELDKRNLATPN